MKAKDISTYLQSLNGGWVNPQETVDTYKAGDPETEVTGIAVGWMSYTWALQKALELGCNVFITHEPTYYDHYDKNERVFALPGVSEKRRWIENKGLVIMRCHDLWDQYPGLGIPDSWADFLELGQPIAGSGYYRVYDAGGQTALEVARKISEKVKTTGLQAVQLFGPAERPVRRVCIGTGAITPLFHWVTEYQVDLAITTDDGTWAWRDGAYAIDMGLPMIVVNHPTSEEPGLINLAKHLREQFPAVPVHHIPQRCMYTLV